MATQSAVTAAASTVSSVVSSVPQGSVATQTTVVPTAPQGPQGIWNSARQLFSLTSPKIGKDGDFTFTFLSSPQRSKPAATVNADNFYMYACGSINMP